MVPILSALPCARLSSLCSVQDEQQDDVQAAAGAAGRAVDSVVANVHVRTEVTLMRLCPARLGRCVLSSGNSQALNQNPSTQQPRRSVVCCAGRHLPKSRHHFPALHLIGAMQQTLVHLLCAIPPGMSLTMPAVFESLATHL